MYHFKIAGWRRNKYDLYVYFKGVIIFLISAISVSCGLTDRRDNGTKCYELSNREAGEIATHYVLRENTRSPNGLLGGVDPKILRISGIYRVAGERGHGIEHTSVELTDSKYSKTILTVHIFENCDIEGTLGGEKIY